MDEIDPHGLLPDRLGYWFYSTFNDFNMLLCHNPAVPGLVLGHRKYCETQKSLDSSAIGTQGGSVAAHARQ